jgi:7-cyano-7-deazaguanine reductase
MAKVVAESMPPLSKTTAFLSFSDIFNLVKVINIYYISSAESLRGSINMDKKPELELFDNPNPHRDYWITIRCPEFTSVCPRTGQPDFGEITIEYCPDKLCIELKSLKLYMQSYRNKGIFYEALTNDILDDLSGSCKPRQMKVTSRFTPRGGITTEVIAEYKKDK